MGKTAEDQLGPGHGSSRNTFSFLVQQMLSVGFSAALTLFLVRALGPAEFGVLALTVSVGTIALLISDFGISAAAARYLAENTRSRAHVAAVLRTGIGLKVFASITSAVLLVLLAPTLAGALDTPELEWPIRVIALSNVGQGIGAFFLSQLTALRRVSLGFRYTLVESSVEASASVCLVLFGAGAAGAVAGRAIGFISAGILVAAITLRLVSPRAIRAAKGRSFPTRRIVGYGAALLVIDGTFAVFDRVDVLIIGAILGSASAGLFEAAARLLALAKYPAMAIAAGFAPRLAGATRAEEDVNRFFSALRLATLFYIFLAAPVLVWAEPIVRLLLGSSYEGTVPVLRISAAILVLSGVSPILALAANYLGEARKRVPLALAALTVNAAIDILLVPRIGISAGAIGTAVAFAIYTSGHVRICEAALDRSFSPLIPTVARGLVAAGAVAILLLALGTGHLSPVAWVVGCVAAPATYVGVLLLLREMSAGEIRWAARRIWLGANSIRHGRYPSTSR